MSDNFYSQATNFTNFVNGGVDQRTGLFTFDIPIATLTGSRLLGPQIDLSLHYSPLNGNASGLGEGISFVTTCYDRYNRSLSLSSGGTFNTQESNNVVMLRQEKLHTVIIEKKGTGYQVLHKSGNIEILSGPYGNDKFYPTTITSASGHSLYLTWSDYQQGARLESIRSDEHELLQVKYHAMDSIIYTVWPGTDAEATLTFNYNSEYLKKVTRSTGPNTPPLVWMLGYQPFNNKEWLTSITSPTGLISEVIYQPNATKFPAASGLPALPAVMQFSQYSALIENTLLSTYEYSPDRNFLGYGEVLLWKPDEDNLYSVLTDYEYKSVETQVGSDGKNRTITRKYNNFHLQTSEETRYQGCSTLQETLYYAIPNVSFDNQPPQFQLPKQVKYTYSQNGVSRSEMTLSEFDHNGNPIREVAVDGSEKIYTYYDPNGEEGCPAEPNGFVRFLKTETSKPSPSTYQDELERSVHYRYARLGDSDVIMLSDTKKYSHDNGKDTLLTDAQLTYIEDSKSYEFGRIVTTSNTLYNLDGSNQPVKLTQQDTITLDDSVLHKVIEINGYDNILTRSTETRSIFNAALLAEEDPLGNKKLYRYDHIGRLLESVIYPDTEYENRTTYEYTLETDPALYTDLKIKVTKTDSKGNQKRTTFDAL